MESLPRRLSRVEMVNLCASFHPPFLRASGIVFIPEYLLPRTDPKSHRVIPNSEESGRAIIMSELNECQTTFVITLPVLSSVFGNCVNIGSYFNL
jgi:hypothetical protein